MKLFSLIFKSTITISSLIKTLLIILVGFKFFNIELNFVEFIILNAIFVIETSLKRLEKIIEGERNV